MELELMFNLYSFISAIILIYGIFYSKVEVQKGREITLGVIMTILFLMFSYQLIYSVYNLWKLLF